MTDEENKKSLEEEAAEQAALPYAWRQTLGDVDVTFQVPQGTRGRDLKISISSTKLSVKLGPEELAGGSLSAPIRADDSTWTLEGRELVVHLEKSGTPAWWAHVLTHHPKIDTTRIVPENSKLGDLDGETRAMVEKMMFDQRAKAAGLPSSEERQKTEMLRKFQASHPEMDFSQAKMS